MRGKPKQRKLEWGERWKKREGIKGPVPREYTNNENNAKIKALKDKAKLK